MCFLKSASIINIILINLVYSLLPQPVRQEFYETIKLKCTQLDRVADFKNQDYFTECTDTAEILNVKEFSPRTYNAVLCLIYYNSLVVFCNNTKNLTKENLMPELNDKNSFDVCTHFPEIKNLSNGLITSDKCKNICYDFDFSKKVCATSYYYVHYNNEKKIKLISSDTENPLPIANIKPNNNSYNKSVTFGKKYPISDVKPPEQGVKQAALALEPGVKQHPPALIQGVKQTEPAYEQRFKQGVPASGQGVIHAAPASEGGVKHAVPALESPIRQAIPASGQGVKQAVSALEPPVGQAAPALDQGVRQANPGSEHGIKQAVPASERGVKQPATALEQGKKIDNLLDQENSNVKTEQGVKQSDPASEHEIKQPAAASVEEKTVSKLAEQENAIVKNEQQLEVGKDKSTSTKITLENEEVQNPAKIPLELKPTEKETIAIENPLFEKDQQYEDENNGPTQEENGADDEGKGPKSNVIDSIDVDGMDGDSYFFSYFMVFCVMVILGYIAYHNRQKLFALLLEGKRNRRPSRARRPNSASYHKLDSNLEEAITSECSKTTTSHVIY